MRQAATGHLELVKGEQSYLVGLSPVPITAGTKDYTFGGSFESIDHKKGNTGEIWFVAAYRAMDKVLAPVGAATKRLVSVGLALVMILSGLALLLSYQLLKPIQVLIEGTNQIGQGDLSARIKVNTRDELSGLAESFNQMAGRLASTMASRDELKNVIAEKEEAERALKKSGQALRRERDRAQHYLDTVQGIIVALDVEGDITLVNKHGCRILGWDASELIGQPWFNRCLPQPEGMREVYPVFKKLVSGELAVLEYLENPILTREGSLRQIAWHNSLLRDETGRIIGTLSAGVDITKRQKAEEALRESEEKYRSMMESLGDPVYICSPDYRVEYMNPAMITRTGRNACGEPCYQAIHGFEEKCPDCRRDQALRGYHHLEMTSPKDGRTYHVTWSPITKRDGSVSILTIFRDITERKMGETKLEAALEEARRRDREITALLEASTAIPLNDTFANTARRIFDIARELIGAASGYVALLSEDGEENEVLFLEAGGLPCTVDPELPMPIRGLRGISYETGEVAYDNDFMNSHWADFMPGGHVVLDNVMFSPLNIKGQTVGIIGLANKPGGFTERDTQVAKAFGDLAAVGLTYAEYQDELTTSKNNLQVIFDNAPAIMFLLNEDREILQINQSGLDLTGRSEDSATDYRVGEFINCVGCFQSDTGCGFGESCRDCELKRIISETFSSDKSFQKEETTITLNQNGVISELPVLVSTAIVSQTPSKKLLLVIDDISDLKKAEEERRLMEGQLRQAQKMEALGTMAGGIAHDFNNILGAIIGFSEMAITKTSGDSPVRADLERVLQGSERAKELVKHILSFSRQAEMERKATSLTHLVKETLNLMRATLPSTIEIRSQISPAPCVVMADPTQVHQTLMNLCSNAAHAMRDQGGRLEIRLENLDLVPEAAQVIDAKLQPGPYVRLGVGDTGHGMGPETLRLIFDPFFTTKEKGEGTGLGLSVVHGIVKSHDGAINVRSEPGRGTEFAIYLPRLEQKEAAPSGSSPPLPLGQGRILLVDDEEALVELGRTMLESLGYEVVALASSVEALDVFRDQPDAFDAVITDQTMPRMTGIELAKEILTIRPDTPIVLCTGFSESVGPQAAEQAGVREFVLKPMRRVDIGQAVLRARAKK